MPKAADCKTGSRSKRRQKGGVNLETLLVNGTEYRIETLLGKGKGGYSYLAVKDEKKYVVKKIHHEPCPYYRFGNKLQAELNDYKRLSDIGISMPKLLDADVEKELIVKEFIEGETVFDLVAGDRMNAEYTEQVKAMCDLLYPRKINIDYFPTNFVVNRGTLYYVDYECNDYSEEWNFENWGIRYWSKTPEFLNCQKERERSQNDGLIVPGEDA